MSLIWGQKVERSNAWNEAMEEYVANGTILADARLQRCISSGSMQCMTDMCWTNLLTAYPQS